MAEKRQNDDLVQNLCAIPVDSFFYPSTHLALIPDFVRANRKLIEVIERAKPSTCAALIRGSEPVAEEPWFLRYGIICKLSRDKNRFFIEGQKRAEILSVTRSENSYWQAQVRELVDEPSEDELENARQTHVQLPMLFGGVESIILALSAWKKKLPADEKEFCAKIDRYVFLLKKKRRELSVIYTTPWHLMVDFSSFFNDKSKLYMLKNDKVIDRLQALIEIFQGEVLAFGHAQSLSALDAEPPIRLEEDSIFNK